MTSLVTASILGITVALGALGCDSNPTPHPMQHTGKGDDAATNSLGGDVTGTHDPGRTDDPSGEYNPGTGSSDDDQNAAPPCTAGPADAGDASADTVAPDAHDAAAGPDAIGDAHDDDNDTTESSDCGPSETSPSGAMSDSDHPQVDQP